jgi:hypothetical protein
MLDRFKPLLPGGDSLWRRARIHRKRDSMMREWKDGFMNRLSLKKPLLRGRLKPR